MKGFNRAKSLSVTLWRKQTTDNTVQPYKKLPIG